MTVDRFDLRDGGAGRYQHWEADGTDYAFHGIFHGEPSPDGIVRTFEFEGMPGTSPCGPSPSPSTAAGPC